VTTWKPTPEECKLIRKSAENYARKRVKLEVGTRYNVNDSTVPESSNLYLVTQDRKGWNDTDLADTISWSDFKKNGVPLTLQGEALVDFYVYSLGSDGELETNVCVRYSLGRIQEVTDIHFSRIG
jgi:hypothetical protein